MATTSSDPSSDLSHGLGHDSRTELRLERFPPQEKARTGSAATFDEAFVAAVSCSQTVCYDKNIPNVDGLRKLFRVLERLTFTQGFHFRLRVIVPLRLEPGIAWERVRKRTAEDIALNVHSVAGGEAETYRIFSDIFAAPCQFFLPIAQRIRGPKALGVTHMVRHTHGPHAARRG